MNFIVMRLRALKHCDEEIMKHTRLPSAIRRSKEIEAQYGIFERFGVKLCAFSFHSCCRFNTIRDDVFNELAKNGINARKYYYPLATDYACCCLVYSSGWTSIAKEAASRVLTLPMYADLDLEVVCSICNIIKSLKNRRQ